jgi:uncharacterized protein (DUF952 family)
MQWLAAQGEGRYLAASLESEGFIHCSKPDQLVAVAEKFYGGQSGLVVLVIDPGRLVPGLKWEAPADGGPPGVEGGDLFPHVYGPINLEAVVEVLDLAADGEGHFSLPPGLQSWRDSGH